MMHRQLNEERGFHLKNSLFTTELEWLLLHICSNAWASLCIPFHLCCYCNYFSSVMKSKFLCKLHMMQASALRLHSKRFCSIPKWADNNIHRVSEKSV